MRGRLGFAVACVIASAVLVRPRAGAQRAEATGQGQGGPSETVKTLVERLELERYKAMIKGLTQFGDRRQGTDRNRKAVDWIEAQLKSYGCTNTERIKYDYQPPPPRDPNAPRPGGAGGQGSQPATAVGGGRPRGIRTKTGVNVDPNAQPDTKVRALDSQESTPGAREEVYCTKIGTSHPEEMYIIGGHMDGIGWGEAANDDGSGTALVMEVARVLSSPDVRAERSVRFVLWNNEETGLNGSRAYVEQRQGLQGKEDPAGSGRYPEPKWLGMITHDMMLFDHGMPRADGTMGKEQRPEADVNIEFQSNSKFAADAQWHQPTDLYTTYSDADFRLGLNAAQTTLAAVAELAGARVQK